MKREYLSSPAWGSSGSGGKQARVSVIRHRIVVVVVVVVVV